MSGRIHLIGCGGIVSGDLTAPLVEADAVVVEDGAIRHLGPRIDVDRADTVIDVRGGLVAPGLIDAHAHPVVGDFTPRQNALGWTSRTLHGGVTSLVSAGETHWPGRLKDGVEAAAICAAAHLTSRSRQPGCSRVFGGALLLDRGIEESDIEALHRLGVRRLGEIGLGSEKDPGRIAALVAFARSLGWVAPLHFGGASVPGSSVVDGDLARAVAPTVISHANGGPTARPVEEVLELIEETDAAIELVFAGNSRAAATIARNLAERGELHRLQFGTDTPSGTGVVPLGLLRAVTEAVSLGGLDPVDALCAATGVTAERYGLVAPVPPGASGGAGSERGLGRIAAGAAADLVVLAPALGSESEDAAESMRRGNLPAVALVVVDGEVAVRRSSTTPPPARPVI
ncbi:hypothetical protein J4H92_07220 [Leucobacter weissii]|uniref:Enamidase n=1 Tax=Leucobacter weissii TaxID=1983706 RepID=A0A939MMX9_9MICO|nr:hypothetical protein [Leucobacter weissii]MBO1901742.1 hypothetical protein [Leucobacter weissii]